MKVKKKISSLSTHFGYQIRLVSNEVSNVFAKKLAALRVTVAEWVVLRVMYNYEGDLSPSLIADDTGLTRGAISKLIDRLIEKKLVVKSNNTDDRRYQFFRFNR